MLKRDDMFEEIAKAEKVDGTDEVEYRRTMVKMTTLVLKLMQNIRSNQTAIMKGMNIPLKEPEIRDENAKKQ
jgi:hypothetical protein